MTAYDMFPSPSQFNGALARLPPIGGQVPHSTLKCNTSGGGDRFSGRMMLRIGQEAATVPVTKQERLPCPRATAT